MFKFDLLFATLAVAGPNPDFVSHFIRLLRRTLVCIVEFYFYYLDPRSSRGRRGVAKYFIAKEVWTSITSDKN
jgi:hypothetical protein